MSDIEYWSRQNLTEREIKILSDWHRQNQQLKELVRELVKTNEFYRTANFEDLLNSQGGYSGFHEALKVAKLPGYSDYIGVGDE